MNLNRVEAGEIFQTAFSFFILFPSVINVTSIIYLDVLKFGVKLKIRKGLENYTNI